MNVNVYDFDNTIYDGETLVDFILYYIKTDPKIWKYIPKLLWIYFKDRFHLFTVEQAIEAYAGFLEGYYVHIDTIEEDVKNFWDKKIIEIIDEIWLSALDGGINKYERGSDYYNLIMSAISAPSKILKNNNDMKKLIFAMDNILTGGRYNNQVDTL